MISKRTQRLIAAAGLTLALIIFATPVLAELAIVAPGSDATVVTRTTAGQTHPVNYKLVRDAANTIKYETLGDDGLGEDRTVESDVFVITVQDAGDSVLVTTKAGRDVAESLVGVGASVVNADGFRIELLSIANGVFTIRVTCENTQLCMLSHVTFTFSEGQRAQAAYD